MEQKQTAVEWLVDEIKKMKIGNNQLLIYYEDLDYLIEKAKQMEKQQIESAYYTGATNFSEHSTKAVRWSKQYYNEEYGNET